MTLYRQLGLLPECSDELGSALHRLESVACEAAYFADSVQAEIGQLALLHVAPDVFNRIEFWCVRGQSFQDQVAVERFDVVLDEATAMRRQAIPDDQQLAANLLDKSLQEFDELRAADRAGMQPEIEVPETDAGDDRQLLPVEAVLQDWGLPLGRPGLDPGGSLAQSAFVDEDDGASFATGLFFNAGQRLVRHCLIAASSRWMARPAGRWLEKPNSRRMRQTLTVLYATPNCRSINLATRASVHSSLANPLATAPASKALSSSFFCAASKPAGRPNGLRRHACASSASFLAQLEAVCRLTSSARATSACATPRASMRMPLRRRNSSSLKSRWYRFVAMPAPRSLPISINVHDSDSVVIHLRKSQ